MTTASKDLLPIPLGLRNVANVLRMADLCSSLALAHPQGHGLIIAFEI